MTNSTYLKIFIILIIALVTSYVIYNYYDNNGQIITIYPDQSATKVKPQEAGGMVVPNANNVIYESLQLQKKNIKQVTLLPEPEKPLNIIHQRTKDGEALDPIDNILADIIQNDQANLEKTDLNQDDDLLLPNIINNESKEAEVVSVPILPNQNKTGLNIVKITENSDKFQVKSQNGKRRELYKVQLASVKSELEAIAEGERIKRKYVKILHNATMTVKKIQYDKGKFFYLVLAGNYNSLSHAKAICKKLSNNQQNCIITNY